MFVRAMTPGYPKGWHTVRWEEAKNFVTFCLEENNNEDVEVKEFGVRLICDQDIQQQAHFQGILTPAQHGGMLGPYGMGPTSFWSW
ncbi:hypothetical protein Tco_0641660 [Tanacetum coccineum]